MINLFAIRSAAYSKNSEACREDDQCCVCGKGIKEGKAAGWLHVHDGGASVVTEAEAETMPEAGDMGMQPIGADCLRKHKAALAAFVTK